MRCFYLGEVYCLHAEIAEVEVEELSRETRLFPEDDLQPVILRGISFQSLL